MKNKTENISVLQQKAIAQPRIEYHVSNTVWYPSFKKATGKPESFSGKQHRSSKLQIKKATTTGDASTLYPEKKMTCKKMTEI